MGTLTTTDPDAGDSHSYSLVTGSGRRRQRQRSRSWATSSRPPRCSTARSRTATTSGSAPPTATAGASTRTVHDQRHQRQRAARGVRCQHESRSRTRRSRSRVTAIRPRRRRSDLRGRRPCRRQRRRPDTRRGLLRVRQPAPRRSATRPIPTSTAPTASRSPSYDGPETSAPATVSIEVQTINDAPSGSNGTVTTAEDTQYTFSAADFGFSDPDDNPPDSLLTSAIATPARQRHPDGGGWPGEHRRPGAPPTRSRSSPAPDETGSPYASFTFQVVDNGGSSNGGQDTDPTPNTMTINVTPGNDAPHGHRARATPRSPRTSRRAHRWAPSPRPTPTPATATAYSLVGTGCAGGPYPGNASFQIVGDELQTAVVFDFETQSSYSVRVRSEDAGGLTVDEAVHDHDHRRQRATDAVDTSADTLEDTSVTIALSGTDPEDDDLTFPVRGSRQWHPRHLDAQPRTAVPRAPAPRPSSTRPMPTSTARDSFTFTVDDGQDTSAPATVSISITSVNDAPDGRGQQRHHPRGHDLHLRQSRTSASPTPTTARPTHSLDRHHSLPTSGVPDGQRGRGRHR